MKKEKIYNYFYIINNLINGRFYLGVHSTNKLADGYFGSGTVLKQAIKKHGKENFELTPLKFFGTRKELLAFEKEIVNEKFLDYYKGICYNVNPGGKGGKRKIFTDNELNKHSRDAHREYYHQNEEYRKIHREYGREYDRKPERKEYHHNHFQQNKEHMREYMREYMRGWRAKKKATRLAIQQGVII